MRRIACVLIVFLVSTSVTLAEDGQGSGKWAKRFWRASIAAVAAGSAVDAQSSLGKHEVNGMLANSHGYFSAQGIGLKLAIVGAAVGTQQYLLHRHPNVSAYKTGAIINFTVAGALGGVAVHNYGTKVAPTGAAQ
jgi:hypothetical protein